MVLEVPKGPVRFRVVGHLGPTPWLARRPVAAPIRPPTRAALPRIDAKNVIPPSVEDASPTPRLPSGRPPFQTRRISNIPKSRTVRGRMDATTKKGEG